MKMIRQFGGQFRAFLPEGMLEQLPEVEAERITDEQRELVEVLREGFNTLSAMQKRVVLLMVDQNMSERKVAKTLGIGYPTVLNHLARARKKLKKYVMQNAKVSISSEGLLQEKNNDEAEADASGDTDTDEGD